MIYIASPYSSPILEAQEMRFRAVRLFTGNLLKQGFVAFSPIVYCHDLAKGFGMKGDAQTWLRFNLSMLRRAEALYLLQLPGWEKSQGVTVELKVAKTLDIPIVAYAEDGTLLSNEWEGLVPSKV